MRKSSTLAILVTILVLGFAGLARGQGKDKRCEEGNAYPRNWIQAEREYIYFFYELCPPDLTPPRARVKVLITSAGKKISIEKWASDRPGADSVTIFSDDKKIYTLYRDLKAVPLQFFKQERRSVVPAEMAAQPFMIEGSALVPSENLLPESAEQVRKVLENADVLIKKAEMKVALLFDSPRIEALVVATERKIKQR